MSHRCRAVKRPVLVLDLHLSAGDLVQPLLWRARAAPSGLQGREWHTAPSIPTVVARYVLLAICGGVTLVLIRRGDSSEGRSIHAGLKALLACKYCEADFQRIKFSPTLAIHL
jgi:hypothetical protein